MEYKADVCRVDNSRLSAWRQGGWLAPCNTFHYTAAESAIGHRRGQWWVSPTSADTQHRRQIHFPGDMSRWRDGREWPCLGPGPGLGRVVENAGDIWHTNLGRVVHRLQQKISKSIWNWKGSLWKIMRSKCCGRRCLWFWLMVAGVWPRPGDDNVRLCTKFKPQFCTFQM